jgi:hypothetical protein
VITPDVRFGSKADMATSLRDVRFTPESRHSSARAMSALGQKQTFWPLFDMIDGALEKISNRGATP